MVTSTRERSFWHDSHVLNKYALSDFRAGPREMGDFLLLHALVNSAHRAGSAVLFLLAASTAPVALVWRAMA
eukprot:15483152-Alexandrium_andersonii.AAC.1